MCVGIAKASLHFGDGNPALSVADRRSTRRCATLSEELSFENPLWGAPHIHGELLKLGFDVAQSTVSKYMVPRRGRPSQTWKTFLHNHADGIASIDLFVVPTIAFEQLFAFLVLGHGRRQLLWFAVTRHPTAEWLARQITEAFPWDKAPAYIVRDNDRAFGSVFTRRIQAMGIRDRPTSIRSPWQNGYVERLIGSIRRECTDHLIVAQRRAPAADPCEINGWRPHVSARKGCAGRAPDRPLRGHRPTCNLGRIASPVHTNPVFGSDTGLSCRKVRKGIDV